jgi:hypothetical protein
MKRITGALSLLAMLGACSSDDDVKNGTDASDTRVSDTVGDTGDSLQADTNASDTVADTGVDAADTVTDTREDTRDTQSSDALDAVEETFDTTPIGDVDTSPWVIAEDGSWVLGRPLTIAGTDGAADPGWPVALGGDYEALVPVRIGSGSVVAEGRIWPAPDTGAHAALVAVSGGLEAAPYGSVERVVYLDGPLAPSDRPSVAVCRGGADGVEAVYATVNDANGQSARLLKISTDLESVQVATFSALTGIGNTVKLGAPVCGGPGFVVTLDALGGASFTAPDGKKSEFSAVQTDNKSLLVNGPKVFGENAAQVVSATSMRMVQVLRGDAKRIYYVGEATQPRTIGDTNLAVGDQLIYQHDYETSTGGSIASQGWFGRQDINLVGVAADGRFAVVWTDVTTGAGGDVVDVVLSVFERTGAKAWNRRASTWSIDRVGFDASGDVRIAGRMKSLEVLGATTVATGLEDAFVAVLGGADGTRKRHANLGSAGVASRVVGPIFSAPGASGCDASGALDAILVATGDTRVAVGVDSAGVRCATEALVAGEGQIRWGVDTAPVVGAFDAWFVLPMAPVGLGTGSGAAWPTGGAVLGAVRGRFVTTL